jgi:urease accessory protein
MLRADKVLAAGTWMGEPTDSVVLEFDERYRCRFLMTGVGGLAFVLDLPEAVMLRGGDGLKLEDGRIVEVLAAPEPLAEIRAADGLALMRLAWHLGNRHLPTELTPKALRIRRDSVIEDMARRLGARVIPVESPFNPEGGAYVQAEASYAHAGEHGHAHNDAAHDHADGRSGQGREHSHHRRAAAAQDQDHAHDHGHNHYHAHHDHHRPEHAEHRHGADSTRDHSHGHANDRHDHGPRRG